MNINAHRVCCRYTDNGITCTSWADNKIVCLLDTMCGMEKKTGFAVRKMQARNNKESKDAPWKWFDVELPQPAIISEYCAK